MPRLTSLFSLSTGRNRQTPTTVLPSARPNQPFSSIPTHIKDVKPQETEPRRLPGPDATVEHMKIFVYDLLCYKGYGIVQKWPQWILETVAVWNLTGGQLRDYAGDWDILCPATGGNAPLNANCKFVLLSEGDCRRGIGRIIEDTVNKFKAQERAAQRQREDWNKTLLGNPPARRSQTRYGVGSSASIAGYPSNASVRSYALSNQAGERSIGPQYPLPIQQQQPMFYPQLCTNNYPLHGMGRYLINNQYAPSVAHTAPSGSPRRSSYSTVQYASSSRGTPVSRTTSASVRSPSTARTSYAGSLIDGASSPTGIRPCVAGPASPYPQAPPQKSIWGEEMRRSSLGSVASRRNSNQSLRDLQSEISKACPEVHIDSEQRQQLPLRLNSRSRRSQGPPLTASNVPYTHTQGLRYHRNQNSAVMTVMTAPNPALSRRSSVTSVSDRPSCCDDQQKPTVRDPSRRRTVGGDSVNLPPRTEPLPEPNTARPKSEFNPHPHATPYAQLPPHAVPYRRTPPPVPVHPDIISASPIDGAPKDIRPRLSTQSLLRSFTSPFRSKKTASTDEFALAQGRFIVLRAGNSQERNAEGRWELGRRKSMMSVWEKDGKVRRDTQGPILRKKDPRTGGPAQTLVESIEIVESMKGRRKLRK